LARTTSEPLSTKSVGTRGRMQRWASIARVVLLVAAVVTLGAWGIFAVTSVAPNPSDSVSVRGTFLADSFKWQQDGYDISPGSAVQFVFDIGYSPNGGGCSGYVADAAKNGSVVASCTLPRPNSTLTSRLADYIEFDFQQDRYCCQQSYFAWVSAPSGNLTAPQGGGGFFEADQEGNYTAHVSNTVPLSLGAAPLGNVNGTLTFSLGHVLFTRPYFTAGLVTLGLAVLLSSVYAASLLSRPRQRRPSIHDLPRSVPKEMAD
jgi:hypothetical protein